jgi:hypothetical protein
LCLLLDVETGIVPRSSGRAAGEQIALFTESSPEVRTRPLALDVLQPDVHKLEHERPTIRASRCFVSWLLLSGTPLGAVLVVLTVEVESEHRLSGLVNQARNAPAVHVAIATRPLELVGLEGHPLYDLEHGVLLSRQQPVLVVEHR